VSSTDAHARQQMLDDLARAVDDLGHALASLGGAYELLDEGQGDRLEEELFRPVQRAYGRARRTYTEFAGRHGLSDREFAVPSPGVPSTGVKGFVEEAVEAVERAEHHLVELQESPMAIEVGDVELRAGLSETRRLIDSVPRQARSFVSTFGR
jgi:hypothetical protein